MSKINVDRIHKRYIFEKPIEKYIIDIEIVHHYLNKPELHIRKIHSDNMIGIVNGLFATDSGRGGIIPIQIYANYLL